MRRGSLRRKIILIFILCTILPSTLVLLFHFHSMNRTMSEYLKSSSRQHLQHAMSGVDYMLTQLDHQISWAQTNDRLRLLLNQSTPVYSEATYQFKKELRQNFEQSELCRSVSAVIISGDNGLNLRVGSDAGNLSDPAIQNILRIAKGTERRWIGKKSNPAIYSHSPWVIVHQSFLYDHSDGRRLGSMLVLLREETVENLFRSIIADGGAVQLVDQAGQLLADAGDYYYNTGIPISTRSAKTGLSANYYIPDALFVRQSQSIIHSLNILVLILIILCWLFGLVLTHEITHPIDLIMKKVARISGGDFSHHPEKLHNNELGMMSASLTEMGDSINQLIQQKLDNEAEKYHLEMKILQNQINPHFLYNTLSSIKMMAMLQHNTGIQNMVDNLGMILRANLSLEDHIIPLSHELQLLESYVKIQNTRLMGKIQYECPPPDPAIAQQPVLKFLLQPLVENAILHGIIPLARKTLLRVTAEQVGVELVLTVEDFGVGMPPEKLNELQRIFNGQKPALKAPAADESPGNGIALVNVYSRLHLQYGTQFHVEISSVLHKGTKVTLFLPLSKEE